MAPVGSLTIASQRIAEPSLAVGRMCRSSGMMTVGPVTTRIAPSNADRGQSKPRRKRAAMAESTHVATTPMLAKLRTTRPIFANSAMSRLRPPSKRMIATERDTMGNSAAPSNSSGSIHPVTPPATKPASSNRKIAGNRKRHDSHWAAIPMTTMPARPMRGCSTIAASRHNGPVCH